MVVNILSVTNVRRAPQGEVWEILSQILLKLNFKCNQGIFSQNEGPFYDFQKKAWKTYPAKCTREIIILNLLPESIWLP